MNLVLIFTGTIFTWRGPAPFYFIAIPQGKSDEIKGVSSLVTYGWGVIPAYITIGETEFKTSLFPKDGKYLVPVKASVRKAESLYEGDIVEVRVEIQM